MPTLLVIDDNASVRETLRFVFECLDFVVVTAESGAQALAFVADHPVNAALVDVYLPGLNGFEVCRELRTRAPSSGQECPVWLMTGSLTSDFPRRAAEAGAVAILAKPFDSTALAGEIRAQLGRPSFPPASKPDPGKSV